MPLPELKVLKGHIILPLADPEAWKRVFPQTKVAKVNGSYVAALPFDVKSVRFLKNRGFNLPSLLEGYNWPGKFTPYAHQKITSDFFVVNPRAFCLSGMGTCKSASALWATDYLMRQGEVKKTLIVAPLSTLDRVWAQEIFHVLPHRRAHILHGSRDKRLALLKDGKADFYIINHDGVEIIFDALAKRPDVNHVIYDELASARNSRTRRARTMFQILNRQGIVRSAWGLTGTPTPNAPTDCFGQIRLLTPERYTGGFRTLQNELMTQVSQFKWVPKHGSAERVYELMQPSIRFALEDCIDLPPTIYQERECELTPQQLKHYKEMERQCFTEIRGQSISAVNAGVLLGKLCQASCIARDTVVLSEQRGWIPIQELEQWERVWDGDEFVSHGGVIAKGRKPVVECHGVWMTPDHLVLVLRGWRTAKEVLRGKPGEGFERAKVWLPNGIGASRDYGMAVGSAMRPLELPVRLREGRYEDQSVSSGEAPGLPTELRVPCGGHTTNTWNGLYSSLQNLVPHDLSVSSTSSARLPTVRWAGYQGLRSLAKSVRELLGRYGADLRGRFINRPKKQRWTIQPEKLSVGYSQRADKQHPQQCVARYTEGSNDCDRSGAGLRSEDRHSTCQNFSVQVAPRNCADGEVVSETYDILNCGPRQRFVVSGAEGPLIVHNCGIMYDGTGSAVDMDFGPRLKVLKEVIEECDEKVIVFVPFTGALNRFYDELKGSWTVEVVDGSVPSTRRNRIFKDFQNGKDPRVILAHPGTMAHGLTLTAATTIVWAAPVTSTETFLQANARISRPGQTKVAHIVMLHGSAVERRLYQTLKDRRKLQDLVLELAKEGRR